MSTTEAGLGQKPSALTELALTLPIFLFYHFGVIFLQMQNSTDVLTHALFAAANYDRERYLLMTLGIGVLFSGVYLFLGKSPSFQLHKFMQLAGEGVIYALLMRVGASWVVQKLFPIVSPLLLSSHPSEPPKRMEKLILSMGAGFYEELAFRVFLFGAGCKLLLWFFSKQKVSFIGENSFRFSPRNFALVLTWASICAALFSGVHYLGDFKDDFEIRSFLFRLCLGYALTFIYVTRGFAAAVWTHTLYDVWVLVLK